MVTQKGATSASQWRMMGSSGEFKQLLKSTGRVYALLQCVMMHFGFTFTGCHSQTGASFLQMQMFAVSLILP